LGRGLRGRDIKKLLRDFFVFFVHFVVKKLSFQPLPKATKDPQKSRPLIHFVINFDF